MFEPWIQTHSLDIQNFIQRLQLLDYNACIVEDLPLKHIEELELNKTIPEKFKIFNRRTIESSKRNPGDIDHIRKEHDFISYHCATPELTKWACQDQRIDAILFSLADIHQLADDSTIILAKEHDKALEIEYYSILTNRYPISFLRNIKKVVFRATKKNLPIIFSSRAQHVENLRSIYSLEGFLDFIDVPSKYNTAISQQWLISRLERNRIRKSSNFIAPGIWFSDKEDTN